MQYNGDANSQDIVSEILSICGATTAVYSLNDITRRFNSALDDYFSIAFENGKGWNFDDINQSSPPIDTQDIVSGTNRYKLSDFTQTIISLIKLEIEDTDGNGLELTPEIITDLPESFEERYINTDSGTPASYCLYGDYIYLTPKPDYNRTAGLKAYFNRPALYLTPSDTTKVPGVPITHHTALCRMASLPFLIEKGKRQAGSIAQLIMEDKRNIASYFAGRNGVKPALGIIQENNK